MNPRTLHRIGWLAALVAVVLVAGADGAAANGAITAHLSASGNAQAPAPSDVPAAIPNGHCLACHGTGLMGAPKVDSAVLAHSVHASLACVSCHASVKKLPHGVPLAPVRCASCHVKAYRTYMDTPHGQAAKLGLATAPGCVSCHGAHGILSPTNPRSRVSAANRAATCRGCHAGASAKLAGYDPHPRPSDPARSAPLAYAHYFMLALLAGVFGFFGLHTLLWLQRGLVGRLRGEIPPLKRFTGPHIQRFTVADRLTHVTVIVSFMLLALTGLPLMHPSAPWAPALTRFWGGVHTMHVIHLVNAGITFGYFFFHLCYLAYRVVLRKQRYRLFGEDSLLPNWTDIKDIGRNFRWFLYLGPQPKMGRWTYWEKFDYWAVFWGVAIIGVSGLMLAAPLLSTRVLSGIWLNVAFIVHSEEALLAVGFIFIFHFFHNHLGPMKFPIDVSIFTGRVPLDRFKEERPLQYQQLLQAGRLEQSIVPPPSLWLTSIAVLFGSAVLITGVTLIALVIFAG